MRYIAAALLCLVLTTDAWCWASRRAVLEARANVMLAVNEPYKWSSADCSMQMWRLVSDVFPELKLTKWFHRTTADAMAGWPWAPVMRLSDVKFGDLLFAGHPKIDHVMMTWKSPEAIIHASKSRGFVRDPLRPYWAPKVTLIVRPPY